MGWFLGIGMLLVNLAAIGVFTGHTERYLRWSSPWRYRVLDSNGDEGCYRQFLKFWAAGVLITSAVLLVLVLTGTLQM
jgi:hypothetical protein